MASSLATAGSLVSLASLVGTPAYPASSLAATTATIMMVPAMITVVSHILSRNRSLSPSLSRNPSRSLSPSLSRSRCPWILPRHIMPA
ncbi:MAG: hypothetical protein M0011_01330 [Elusimicrobia bacterium]|nr:hypothetical protein [Elusimicrobiota bacterium]